MEWDQTRGWGPVPARVQDLGLDRELDLVPDRVQALGWVPEPAPARDMVRD